MKKLKKQKQRVITEKTKKTDEQKPKRNKIDK